ncbi:MAG: hypothetical protein Q7U89_06440 [Coriobacteriia bacterium]|nr:hypothetical protein [Coriobacteriia bacterium]
MSEREQRGARDSRLVEWAPGIPADSEVENMAEKARHLAGPGARNPKRRWLVAVALTLVAAAVTLATMLAPGHLQTPAFARERATDALNFYVDGRVTHMELALTMRQRGIESDPECDPRADVNQRWSVWADADGKRTREEFVNIGDGSLEVLSVEADRRKVTLLTGPRYKPVLLDDDANRPFGTTVDQWVRDMRSMIADDSAKVTGTKMIDDEEYWVIENKVDGEGGGESVEILTMRKSDYRVGTWSLTSTVELENGTVVISKQATLQLFEQLDPSSLARDFFSPDVVKAVYKAAISAEKP